jgi:hypothetical protein
MTSWIVHGAAALLAAGQESDRPNPPASAFAERPATPIATFALASDRHEISPDERFALLRAADGLLLLALPIGAATPLPEGGPWQAGAFDAAGRPPRFHDLVVAADGAHVAWSMTAGGERIAGVNAVASGEEVARFHDVDTAAMSDLDLPWIAFVGDGKHVVVQARPVRAGDAVDGGPSGGARRGGLEVLGHDGPVLTVWELATGRAVASFSPYVSSGTPGYALLPDGLAVGTRADTHRWPVLRWRLGEAGPTVLLPDARGGHFTDLHVEPRGRVLCEWDREDGDGIVVLDLEDARPPRTIAPGHAFVGFASAPIRDEIPASGGSLAGGVLGCAADGTLRLFCWATGEPQREFALDPAFHVSAARWSQRVQRVLAIGWRAPDREPRDCWWEAQLIPLGPDGD